MFSFQKKLVLLLTLILHSASAFVGSSSSYRRPRRGARGGADQSTIQRTSLAEQSTSTVVLQMAPKKKAAADPETLRKKDIVATISEQLDITKTDADAAVSAVFDAISDVSFFFHQFLLSRIHSLVAGDGYVHCGCDAIGVLFAGVSNPP